MSRADHWLLVLATLKLSWIQRKQRKSISIEKATSAFETIIARLRFVSCLVTTDCRHNEGIFFKSTNVEFIGPGSYRRLLLPSWLGIGKYRVARGQVRASAICSRLWGFAHEDKCADRPAFFFMASWHQGRWLLHTERQKDRQTDTRTCWLSVDSKLGRFGNFSGSLSNRSWMSLQWGLVDDIIGGVQLCSDQKCSFPLLSLLPTEDMDEIIGRGESVVDNFVTNAGSVVTLQWVVWAAGPLHR